MASQWRAPTAVLVSDITELIETLHPWDLQRDYYQVFTDWHNPLHSQVISRLQWRELALEAEALVELVVVKRKNDSIKVVRELPVEIKKMFLLLEEGTEI